MENKVLTELFKKTILKVDLYDTGALYNSVIINSTRADDAITLNISCKDYVKYHLIERHLIPEFTNTVEFSNEISGMYESYLQNKIENSWNNSQELVFNPRLVILINGI